MAVKNLGGDQKMEVTRRYIPGPPTLLFILLLNTPGATPRNFTTLSHSQGPVSLRHKLVSVLAFRRFLISRNSAKFGFKDLPVAARIATRRAFAFVASTVARAADVPSPGLEPAVGCGRGRRGDGQGRECGEDDGGELHGGC